MISKETRSKIISYWQRENVHCQKASVGGPLRDTELGEFWESIGMPTQDWWLFRFAAPSTKTVGLRVVFGTVGENWKLIYKSTEGSCIFIDEEDRERFANSSFVTLMEMLIIFDSGYRKMQRECMGDSGADWDRGDIIIKEMEASMRSFDPHAFESSSNLWPCLLVDING